VTVTAPTLPPPEVRQHIAAAIAHRPAGYLELCRECGWHYPCPPYFRAKLALIIADVPPIFWAR
jgi:hypothetical protein